MKEFRLLTIDHQFLLLGNSLIIVGGGLIAFGRLLRLMKDGAIPMEPMQTSNNNFTSNIPSTTRSSYFTS